MVGYISWDQFVVNRDRLAKIVRSAPWRMRIDRARYEAELAERRYEAVDPANRLIAATLEQRWNDALQRLQDLETELAAFERRAMRAVTAEQKKRILQQAGNSRDCGGRQ